MIFFGTLAYVSIILATGFGVFDLERIKKECESHGAE